MAGATNLPATRLGPLLIGALVVLSGFATGETLSGKIRSIDRTAHTVNIRTLGSEKDRTLRIGRETVIAGLPGVGDWAGLSAGQVIIAALDAETTTIKKLQVVMSPALTGTPPPRQPTTQSLTKPQSPEIRGELTRADANRAYRLSTETVRSIDAVLTYEMMVPGVTAREWVVVAAQAPELPGQMNARSSLDPGGQPTWDLSPGSRPLLVSRVAADSHGTSNKIAARVQYQATLLSRHLERRQAGDEGTETDPIPLGNVERQRALARGGTYELDAPEFRRWLSAESLAMNPRESEIDYARRVFLVLKRSFTYEFQERMDRRLSRVCTLRRSDCGGLSILLVAALRTQGIPARILVGRWAKSAEPGAQLGGVDYYQWHVKAEFYADGVGWIPADPAAGLVYDQAPDGLRYFGHDEGDFLTLHVDPDLVLDTVHFGAQPTPFLNGGLGVWVVGTGSLVNPRVRQDWLVREVGAPSRPRRLAESSRGTPTSR
ncbi:transglutaminase-like enzyme, predicted cysteine protease [Singulisphaera acidiphila DSM 18658]|uniref:Transglutaminase-like enzyme, predicted cysteine protease n=1 Tax=Singulisphaera acidiphila (strain ATCC BAA-1392 / DSM 18658 / VKM B-2454 / MOB10) TaxID=886293 RepID=L0DKQ9_SINAD|nr:transglutaminase-like enzyme, predicted cysteine protease [Singulisphaera acidiphila DSM 18658]